MHARADSMFSSTSIFLCSAMLAKLSLTAMSNAVPICRFQFTNCIHKLWALDESFRQEANASSYRSSNTVLYAVNFSQKVFHVRFTLDSLMPREMAKRRRTVCDVHHLLPLRRARPSTHTFSWKQETVHSGINLNACQYGKVLVELLSLKLQTCVAPIQVRLCP